MENTTPAPMSASESYIPPPPQDPSQSTGSISTSKFTQMTAVERSKALLVVKTEPHLQFMCGPLLKYDTIDEDGTWHGAVMIVTADSVSIYDPPPTLSYFWDPDQSVPAHHQMSNPSISVASYDLGLHPSDPHSTILPTSTTFSSSPQSNLASGESGHGVTNDSVRVNGSRRTSNQDEHKFGPGADLDTGRTYSSCTERVSGQELWVYVEERGTFTFWRFLITVPLSNHEMVIKYSVNNGQPIEFWVPGKMQNMRWAAYSCNGFSTGVNPDDFRGPGFKSGYDPVWMDLLTKHDQQPFHALVGAGNQLYCDDLMREAEIRQWNSLDPKKKLDFLVSPEMELCIDRFLFNNYCQAFRRGAFARANCSIPMLNMCNDHEFIEGFGSYPDDLQKSPVFRQIGARGYFFFLLFQCFINVEVDGLGVQDLPGKHVYRSLVTGEPGPYVRYPSHSFLPRLGPQVYMLLLDCRAERKEDQVCSMGQYERVFERLNSLPSGVEHVIIQLGMPIAFPNMSGENFLSKIKKKDHWNAQRHKTERNWLIKQLQEFALHHHIRFSFLSGDVSCAAVGVFKTHVKDETEVAPSKWNDYRYMVNIVTSAIVNTPPSNKIVKDVSSFGMAIHWNLHSFKTDKEMVDFFPRDIDGQSNSNKKFLMGKRNWCMVNLKEQTRELVFEFRVEKEKGYGETVGYPLAVPPGWSRY